MTYSLEISEHADRIFSKLAKKDKTLLEAINNKIKKILENPQHFKPLRGDMHGSRRIHFDPFVLVFEIDEGTKTVRIIDFGHHDKVY
ncbi:TPA: type II toxin-antitoxin system mRNA interferase toxin, RelE/StbE family [Candidatus Micrarchaeota archaeon]|nr:type II toxin-antitoxin system mRNA interferase toxin, RelE/StbE family [Candidatus Micrarchaeota archaeon]HIH30001.1 type II toxin-antitoxin system mRNA interferase toxin, RelE/StbE family [Candidatus Micrarchaeota archaeon]